MTDTKLNHSAKLEKNILSNESRRQFIRGFGLMVGSSVAVSLLSGNAISAALAYTPKIDSALKPGLIFNRAEMKILEQICAQVIPTTDTLGAADVDVHGFIDNQLHYCHSKNEQNAAKRVLSVVATSSKSRYKNKFSDIKASQQVQLLNELEQAKKEFNQANRNEFKQLKRLICFGYYTSEVGGSKELRYLPIPGGFKGSIPYTEGDASWST